MKYKLLILFPLILTGCVSVLDPGDMDAVATNNPEKATVYVFNSYGGNLLVINGNFGGVMRYDTYTWFHIDAGEIRVSMNDPMLKKRKLSANVFQVEVGKTYYIDYNDRTPGESDADLLHDIFTGASKGRDFFKKEDLKLISEDRARVLINEYKLSGNTLPE